MDNNRNTQVTHPEHEVNAHDSKIAKPSAPAKRQRRFPRKLIYLLGGLGIAGLMVYLLRPHPISVDMGTIERGELQVTVDAEGKTRVQDRFVIATPVEGRLRRIELEEGDSVEAGMVVAQIDPLPYTTQVREAQARLREFQAQLEGVETRRPKAAELDQARSRINAAQAAQQAAQAQVAQAEAALEQARRTVNGLPCSPLRVRFLSRI